MGKPLAGAVLSLAEAAEPLSAGAERSSAFQHAILVTPTPKRHFAPGQLQFLTSSIYRRARLFESEQFRVVSKFGVEAALRRQVATQTQGCPN